MCFFISHFYSSIQYILTKRSKVSVYGRPFGTFLCFGLSHGYFKPPRPNVMTFGIKIHWPTVQDAEAFIDIKGDCGKLRLL